VGLGTQRNPVDLDLELELEQRQAYLILPLRYHRLLHLEEQQHQRHHLALQRHHLDKHNRNHLVHLDLEMRRLELHLVHSDQVSVEMGYDNILLMQDVCLTLTSLA
jgi:hypothetical protein